MDVIPIKLFQSSENTIYSQRLKRSVSHGEKNLLRERGSRDNCLLKLIILPSFLANRYCSYTTRQEKKKEMAGNDLFVFKGKNEVSRLR